MSRGCLVPARGSGRLASRPAALAAVLLTGCALAAAAARASDMQFTLAIVPDVQQECWDTRFANRMQWLVDNRSALNIAMMLQVGDMMNYNNDDHYAHMSEGLVILDDAGFPYATAIGNHDTAAVLEDGGSAAPGDVNENLRNTTKYNTYFPTTRFMNLAGVSETGKIDNAYHTFRAGGLDWLVLNLELWPRAYHVGWAKTVVENHPDHNVIVLTHSHLNSDSTIKQDDGGYGDNSPQYVFDNLIKQYANVRLVFCGHVGTHGYRTDTGVHGNTIHSYLQCYHDGTTNPVRLLEIDTVAGTMASRVYCPFTDEYKSDGSTYTVTGVSWVESVSAPRLSSGLGCSPQQTDRGAGRRRGF